MKIAVSHPTSNQNNRAVLQGFLDAEILHSFHTSIAVFPNDFLDKISKLKIGALSEISRREFNENFSALTKSYPTMEIARLLAIKMKLDRLVNHEDGIFSVDSVYTYIDRKLSSFIKKEYTIDLTGVYAYEDGAYSTFLEAKKNKIQCIYDLPIAYWQTKKDLILEESERLPAWSKTIASGISDSDEKLARKEMELELADTIVLPSKFVKDSLPDWARSKKIIMSPFGSPKSTFNINSETTTSSNNKILKVLFVGSMSQRKGLGDLFEAMNIINSKQVELIVLGSLRAPLEFYNKQIKNGFTYENGRSHKEVLELMRTCDVFCLPSIVEGRALVMQEAMSQGLPIIITPNTGGEDLVIDGKTGFLIPIRSPQSIADKLNWFLENRSNIPEMGKIAQKHAKKYTWEKYGAKIVNELQLTN